MNARVSRWHSSLAALILLSFPTVVHAGSFENGVLVELNNVRAHPQAYARELRREQVVKARYSGEPGALAQADPDAVDDAIDALMRQRPLPPLARDSRLVAAAHEYAARQGPTGDVGHGAPGGMGRRLQSKGMYAGIEAESISYGQRNPRDVVRQLIIDSGVPDRGHRKDLLSRGFQVAGVGCGRHARYGSMCVIDLAGAVVHR
jgi:uncharacterized protein YkwD